jgi:hypothetical protein
LKKVTRKVGSRMLWQCLGRGETEQILFSH